MELHEPEGPRLAGSRPPTKYVDGWWFVFCEHCGRESIWLNGRMIYPNVDGGPPPNPDLPEDIRGRGGFARC